MKTLNAVADAPDFDIRTVPIWAVGQIREALGRNPQMVIVRFTPDRESAGTEDARGVLSVEIPEEGRYITMLHKRDMNRKGMPHLYAPGWEPLDFPRNL